MDTAHLIAHIEENIVFIEQIEELKNRIKKLEAEVKKLKKRSNSA